MQLWFQAQLSVIRTSLVFTYLETSWIVSLLANALWGLIVELLRNKV